YDKSQQIKPFCSGLNNLAVQNYYYSYQNYDGTRDLDSVEEALNTLIEGPTNKILPKLLFQQPLGEGEKYQVAKYLCIMFSRVPAYKQFVNGFFATFNIQEPPDIMYVPRIIPE